MSIYTPTGKIEKGYIGLNGGYKIKKIYSPQGLVWTEGGPKYIWEKWSVASSGYVSKSKTFDSTTYLPNPDALGYMHSTNQEPALSAITFNSETGKYSSTGVSSNYVNAVPASGTSTINAGGWCIASGEKVLLVNNTYKLIDDLTTDDIILSYDINNNQIIEVNIKYINKNDLLTIYLITLESGISVKCTNDHKILTISGWKSILDGLSSADLVCTVDGYSKVSNINEVGESNTYCIGINMDSEDNNFYVNGIVVHNASCDMQSMVVFSNLSTAGVLDGQTWSSYVLADRGTYTLHSGTTGCTRNPGSLENGTLYYSEPNYGKGDTRYEDVYSEDSTAYPDNGEKDGYWYVKVVKPSSPEAIPYDGQEHTNGVLSHDKITMTGQDRGTSVGTYVAYYTPKSGYLWSDGTNSTITVTLTIYSEVTYEGLTFTAEESNVIIGIKRNNTSANPDIQYSTDGIIWNTFAFQSESLEGTIVTLVNTGDRVYLKGNNPSGFNFSAYYCTFIIDLLTSASGNIMSLLDDGACTLTTIPNPACFAYLFLVCNITTPPELKATSLTAYCYREMFKGCSRLTTAPSLPATKLMPGCYWDMFAYCINLTTVPKLPATLLSVANAYRNMFLQCTSLIVSDNSGPGYTHLWNIPQDSVATRIALSCGIQMFQECAIGSGRVTDNLSDETVTNVQKHYYTLNEPV